MSRDLPGLGRPYEEMKRTSRIIELVQIIAIAPRRYLRRDLADRFEMSERMIQKDLNVIRHGLKLPLVHSPEGYYFEKLPHLPALQYTFAEALALLLAVQAARQVSGISSAERVVHPYHIMPYVRSWQLIGYCEWRREVRIFKLDRISTATLLDERYAIPDDFNLEEYLGATWGLMRGKAGEPVNVVLRFEPEAGTWVGEEYWHPGQQVEGQPDGSVLFRLHIAVTPEFVNWLLYYGSRVEVLEPASLRERVAEEHRRAAEMYGKERISTTTLNL